MSLKDNPESILLYVFILFDLHGDFLSELFFLFGCLRKHLLELSDFSVVLVLLILASLLEVFFDLVDLLQDVRFFLLGSIQPGL